MSESLPIGVQAIDHITIIVKDLGATRRFYVDFLGMDEVPRPNFDFPGLWFQCGIASIHATLEDEFAGRAGWGDYQGAKLLSRGHHFAFLVEDVDAVINQIDEAGIEVLVERKQRPDGAKQIYIADPDGHVVELASTNSIST